jgi:radical SAM protein with 4Fe4S-binding SPASM domain
MVSPSTNSVSFYIAGGGEPTYNWGLFRFTVECIKKACLAKKIDYTIGITTNGCLNKTQLNFIIENSISVLVSFDGTKLLQNQNRKLSNGTGSFDIVTETMDYLYNNDYNFSIRSTMYIEDLKYLQDIYLYISERYPNILALDVEPVFPRGRAKKQCDMINSYSFAAEYIKVKKYIFASGKRDFLDSGKFKQAPINFLCGTILGMHPWLLADGKIVTCMDGKENATVVGKITDDQLQLVEFSDQHAERLMENMGECKQCFAYKFCLSGCPLKTESKESTEVSLWSCREVKKYWEYVFDSVLENQITMGWKIEKISKEHKLHKLVRA